MTTARLNRSPAGAFSGGGINTPYMESPTSDDLKIPEVDEALIRHLKETFRYTPEASHTLRDLDRAVGHLQVISHLQGLLEVQQAKEAEFTL